jgi:hypothetical protein
MSRHCTVNLMELDDAVGERAPGIEGRFTRSHIDSRDLGVSRFTYAPNLRSAFAHSHREQELRQWDVVRVAPEVVRAFEAGPDGLDLIAVGGPRPAEGDGVMGAAEWPDAAE